MMYLLNAFSMNMVAGFPLTTFIEEVSLQEAQLLLSGEHLSAVGHADTAAVFSEQLGFTVPMNRVSLALHAGDVAVIGQYRGPRLAEGASTLPAGATIQWLRVTLK